MERHTIERWMSRALSLAEEAALSNEVPVGAVLVSIDGELLAEARNERESLKLASAHAEMLALDRYSHRNGTWRLPLGTSLISTVEPCLMCAGALLHSRVNRIYYGCPDPKGASLQMIQSEIAAGRFDHKIEHIEGGVLEDKCVEQIRSFFQRRREEKKNPPKLASRLEDFWDPMEVCP